MYAKVHNSRHRFEINTNFHSSLDLCDLNYQVSSLLKVTELVYTLSINTFNIKKHVSRYYYSIYDMIVRGSCSCYGHADRYQIIL